MATSAKLYGKCVFHAFDKQIDWEADTIKCSLHTSGYTPNQDTHEDTGDLSNEVSSSGTNYTTGGNTVGSCTLSYISTGNIVKLDGADVTFSNVTLTARYAVIYDSTSGKLIAYLDFGADVSPVSGDLVVGFSADGVVNVTAA